MKVKEREIISNPEIEDIFVKINQLGTETELWLNQLTEESPDGCGEGKYSPELTRALLSKTPVLLDPKGHPFYHRHDHIIPSKYLTRIRGTMRKLGLD